MRFYTYLISHIRLTSRFIISVLLALFYLTNVQNTNAADFVVTNSNDSGPNSLRQAIIDANSNPGLDTISFNINLNSCSSGPLCVGGTLPATITPASALPSITDLVVVDGYTQPGSSPNSSDMDQSINAILKIELNGTNAGSANGLTVLSGGSTVRGLVVNRFAGAGIYISTNGQNLIEGNFIGTNARGNSPLANFNNGIVIDNVGNNVVGGLTPDTRNLISSNISYGLQIKGSSASSNQVQGNFIGTNVSGTGSFANSFDGIRVEGAPNNLIGGVTLGSRNLISGNGLNGVVLVGSNAAGNLIQGNFIGTNLSGTAVLSNFSNGITIVQALNNTIGGVVSGAGNLISGNGRGIEMSGNTSGNQVQGNFIGTDISGHNPLGNLSDGILFNGASINMVGGPISGSGNTIAFNGGDGVHVFGPATSVRNSIRSNSIHTNNGKGIENFNGGNAELAPPVIISTNPASGTACSNCYIDVFSDDDSEGRIYHGLAQADGGGNWSFPGAVQGPKVTATATNSLGNTSEFSIPVEIPSNLPPTVDAGGPYTVNEGESVQLTATGNDPENGILTYAWDLDNNGSFETPGQTATFSAENIDGPSSQTVVVQVTDNGNLTATDQAIINVLNVDPVTVIINSSADTYVRSGQANQNEGGGQFMRLQSSGDNRSLVRFDQGALQQEIGSGTVISAKLKLTITDNANNWGSGRTIDIHRLISDWAEGNGTENDRGEGSGATWNCAIDTIIQNQVKDCSGTTEWEMGQPNNPSIHPWIQTPTATQTITNNQTGTVEFDVTPNVASFLNGSTTNFGWIIKKTEESQTGQVSFGTKESIYPPQLVIIYQP